MKPLGRRTFLRGAAAAIALPRLEAMLNGSGTAYAQGMPLPKRFVTWFWGNGNEPAAWTPSGTGAGWTPSAGMAGLAPIKSDVSVVSGMTNPVRGMNNPHVEGVVGLLAGGNPLLHPSYTGANGDWNYMTVPGPSLDQVIAQAIGATTRYRSLEIGVTPQHGSSGPGSAVSYISHSGSYNPNVPQNDPAMLFQRLFSGGVPMAPKPDPMLRVRGSILDAVKEDAAALRVKLGTGDRVRLDAHLDGVRQLEQRIQSVPPPPATSCRAPTAPGPTATVSEKARLMGDLAAMALACDLTRVITFEFSSPASHESYEVYPAYLSCGGEPKSFHEYEHCVGFDTTVRAVLKYFVDQYAAFVQTLKALPEGQGSLLDQSCVLGLSELGAGYSHGHDNVPLLVAGKAGGGLTGGQHVAAPGASPSRLMLTLLQALGVPRQTWGLDQFETSSPLTGL